MNFKEDIIKIETEKAMDDIILQGEHSVNDFKFIGAILKQALVSALDQVIARTDKWLPEEKEYDRDTDNINEVDGHNSCRSLYLSNKQKDLE